MVDNRFIEVLNGRDLITLFQPAHSVMQAGVGPIRKLARGFVSEGVWVAQSKATRPCRYCTVFTPIRKVFMQGRHVGHGIISTGDLGLAGSRDCLTGSSEQGTDTPSSNPDIQVDRCQTSDEGTPQCFCFARRDRRLQSPLVFDRIGRAPTGLCWYRALPKKPQPHGIRSYDPRKPLRAAIFHDIRVVAAARRSCERERVAPGGGLSL